MIFLLSPNKCFGLARAILEASPGLAEKQTGFVPSSGIESRTGWAGEGIALVVDYGKVLSHPLCFLTPFS